MGAVAEEFFSLLVRQARRRKMLSDEHFTVDGTLIEAWAGQMRIPLKAISQSGGKPITIPGETDQASEQSDAGTFDVAKTDRNRQAESVRSKAEEEHR